MNQQDWVRPYWHVDAKWVFGLMFTFFLSASLILSTLATLLSAKVAIPLTTYVVALQFSRDGLDDPQDVEKFRQQYSQTTDQNIYPIEGMDVSVTRQELYSLSPRQLRLKIFRQLIEPIYYQQATSETMEQYGFLAFLNQQTADQLSKLFVISLAPLALTLIGLVGFSYRYGRLISPAVPLLLTSAPFALLLFLLQNVTPPAGDEGPFSTLPRELLLEVTSALSPTFYTPFGIGFGLITLAIIIKLFSLARKPSP